MDVLITPNSYLYVKIGCDYHHLGDEYYWSCEELPSSIELDAKERGVTMFEKEADFAETKMLIVCHGDYSKKKNYREGWQDGATFGYNKANEWHYPSKGEYPKDNTQVLVLLENKRMKISIFMEKKFTVWNKDYNTYTKLYNVIAWKEIVLPKETKEKC